VSFRGWLTQISVPRVSVTGRVGVASIAALMVACAGSALAKSPHEDGAPSAARASADLTQPTELGEVAWFRDFDAAREESRRTGKPMLVFFSEVPGCQTCRSFGSGVLSNPLVVEAAESLFVPVAVYNNVENGRDEKVLKSFNEPAWNNPAMRIITSEREELSPRVYNEYTVAGVTRAMTAALRAAGRDVPSWLDIVQRESASEGKTETAVFAMHCFWQGEAVIGSVPGVTATKAGFLENREVVEVTFDPRVVSFLDLLSLSRQSGCASHVYARSEQQLKIAGALVVRATAVRTDAPVNVSEQDRRHHLALTHYRAVPMTPMQAMRVNSAIATSMDPAAYLSPRQLALAELVKAGSRKEWPMLAGESDLLASWRAATNTLSPSRPSR
jgi:hypothetical protein